MNPADEQARNERHKDRMQRKKTVVDEKIAQAKQDKGLIVVTTGNGKGKSSSAFGMVARALGHGMRVGIIQFIKGAATTGEEAFFRRFPEVEYHVMGEGFTWETQNRERDIVKACEAWMLAAAMLKRDDIGLIVLDELNIALKYGYLDLDTVIVDLQARPDQQHVVITGRGAKPELIDIADTVTDMEIVKHAFKQGIRPQPGIEY